MTEKGLVELFVVLDQVWGDMDSSREAGYALVLDGHRDADVAEAVRQMMQEDRKWLPKAPEIAAVSHQVRRRRETRELVDAMQARIAKRLGIGSTQQAIGGGDVEL